MKDQASVTPESGKGTGGANAVTGWYSSSHVSIALSPKSHPNKTLLFCSLLLPPTSVPHLQQAITCYFSLTLHYTAPTTSAATTTNELRSLSRGHSSLHPVPSTRHNLVLHNRHLNLTATEHT
jgi:hypothetical protein